MLRAQSTSGPAMACPFVSITAGPTIALIYTCICCSYHSIWSPLGIITSACSRDGRTVRAGICIQVNIAICGRGAGRLPSQRFRTVLNSVPTVPAPIASSRLLVSVIPQ